MRRTPQPRLINLGLGVEHRRDHRCLGAQHRAEAIVFIRHRERVFGQDGLGLVERPLRYALKLS